MTTLQSHLLIANPDLTEPFNRSVVLIVRHNSDGALGLILNHRSGSLLQESWEKLSDVPCHRQAAIFLGGPCEGPLVALHTQEFLVEMEVMPGLYFCAGKEKLETLASQNDDDSVKFFGGYSGWSPGQLENEIAEGSWSIMPATIDQVFAPEDDLWQRTTRLVADAARRRRLGSQHGMVW